MPTVLADNCGGAIELPPGFETIGVVDKDPVEHVFEFRDPLGRVVTIGTRKPSPTESGLSDVLAKLESYAAMLGAHAVTIPTPLETL